MDFEMISQGFLLNPWFWVIATLWTLPWKAYAMWTAARKGHKIWFVAFLVVNTVAILEIAYLLTQRSKDKESENTPSSLH